MLFKTKFSSQIRISLTLLFSWFIFYTQGQEIIISGKILEESMLEPIPFCNIVTKPGYKGTFSNEDGEFLIKVDALPVTLAITNIAFQPKEIILDSPGYFTIKLNRAATVLDEIVIKERKFDRFAINLAKKAYNRIQQTKGNFKYGKAFYRQKSINNNKYVELMEIFYDVRYDNNGIDDWEVQEGRYAEDKRNLLNRNFTLLSKLFPMLQPPTDELYLAMVEDLEDIYEIYVEDIVEADGHKMAIISFTPHESEGRPAFNGQLYIDIDTYDILKVSGGFKGYDLPFIQLTEPLGSYKKLNLQFEIAYKRDSLDELLMDFVKMDQTFDYYYDGKLKYPVHTESFLTFYDYYIPVSRNKKLGGKLKYKNDDRAILDLVGYNKRFWRDNPVVKRTPVEEEVINSFEKDEAFGTIYLNSFEQIALNETDIENEAFLQELLVKVNKEQVYKPIEKIYIHADKSFYQNGESIWYTGYIVDANGLYPTDISYVLHINLIDPNGQIVSNQKIPIFNGISNGQIQIPKDIKTGKYQLRAYTQWMRNREREYYFEKTVDIYNATEVVQGIKDPEQIITEDIDLQFFPEGGDYVEKLNSIVAFKAIDETGESIPVNGQIIDEDGDVTGFFKSIHEGMGQFQFKPNGKKNFARIDGFDKSFVLPAPLKQGYVIHIRNSHPKSLKIRLLCSESLEGDPIYVIGMAQGNVYFRQKYDIKNGVINIEIPKNHLPSGVFTITLLDKHHKPRAERIVFIQQKDQTQFEIEPYRMELDEQDQISLNINAYDEEGKPVETKFSLAVTDMGLVERSASESNILSQLLLESELRGNINSPGSYFEDDDRINNLNLDLVMMTHGWRKYEWARVLNDQLIDNFWMPEKGINIKGVATDPSNNEPLINKRVALLSVNDKFPFSVISRTNNFGIFEIESLRFNTHDRLIFKVLEENGLVIPADVVWEPKKIPVSTFRSQPISASNEIKQNLRDYLEKQQLLDTTMADRILEEVVIEARRLRSSSEIQNNAFIIDPNKGNRSYTDIFQLLITNVPGILVKGSGHSLTVSLDGKGTPLFIVDGIEMNQRNLGFSNATNLVAQNNSNNNLNRQNALAGNLNVDNVPPETLSELIGWLPPSNIKRIEVLKRFHAAAYGYRGNNGVIIIHTFKGYEEDEIVTIDPYEIHIQEKGFEPVKTFYQPKYTKSQTTSSHTYPPTIYWLPTGSTNDKGQSTINFFVPKEVDLQFVIEGLSVEGKPGIKFSSFYR